jgi:flavin-dependent dehydrogenase
MTTDVLIVGAGPTGLTLAVDLAHRGVAATVVEAATEPSHQSRGKGLQPRAAPRPPTTRSLSTSSGLGPRLFIVTR